MFIFPLIWCVKGEHLEEQPSYHCKALYSCRFSTSYIIMNGWGNFNVSRCARAVTPTSPSMAQPSEGNAVGGLVAVVDQLVQDVAEDAEVYQQAFPDTSPVSLPAISARCAAEAPRLSHNPRHQSCFKARTLK